MRQNVIRLIAFWVLASVMPASGGTSAPQKLSCKRVRDAVWAGHTLDQLTTEFDTDAQHIMKCLQSRKGKKRAATKKEKKTAKGKSAPAPQPGK
jgi:hypothetical protein